MDASVQSTIPQPTAISAGPPDRPQKAERSGGSDSAFGKYLGDSRERDEAFPGMTVSPAEQQRQVVAGTTSGREPSGDAVTSGCETPAQAPATGDDALPVAAVPGNARSDPQRPMDAGATAVARQIGASTGMEQDAAQMPGADGSALRRTVATASEAIATAPPAGIAKGADAALQPAPGEGAAEHPQDGPDDSGSAADPAAQLPATDGKAGTALPDAGGGRLSNASGGVALADPETVRQRQRAPTGKPQSVAPAEEVPSPTSALPVERMRGAQAPYLWRVGFEPRQHGFAATDGIAMAPEVDPERAVDSAVPGAETGAAPFESAGRLSGTGPAPAGTLQRPEFLRGALPQITEAIRAGNDGRLDVRLNPVELGRLHLAFSQSDSGLNVVIHADRTDTQDLVRRHADLLMQELRSCGYDEVTLDFGWNGSGRSGQSKPGTPSVQAALADAATDDSLPRQGTSRHHSGTIDIRL
ncbi:flagellar hook-length control protein FliK [Tropicimonas sp.]|uniref:flagellar hook-length control protein FliK n=1 Tax=Tropicimonas sp. TaxID=2067044 RepID=UPI003A8739A7